MLVVGCVLMLELELRHGLHDVLDGRREIPVEFGRVTSLEESRDSQRRWLCVWRKRNENCKTKKQ